MSDNAYTVVITVSQEVKMVQCDPDIEIFDTARDIIGCDWIEIVEPETLAKENLVFLIDEEGKLGAGTKFLNCIASHLYETEKHGDPIVGTALIVKAGEEELTLLTEDESNMIRERMLELREKSIKSIAGSFGLLPAAKRRNEIRQVIKTGNTVDAIRRQPCGNKEMER